MAQRPAPAEWPALPYEEWSATKKTLHLYTQIVGKVRLALSPAAPGWAGAPLLLTARGLSTGPMPWGTASVEIGFDFLNHRLAVVASDGWSRLIPLTPARSVAELYVEVMRALDDLGVSVEIWTKPQEVPDTTPLDENDYDRTYDPAAIRRWFRALTATANVFDEWQAGFFGRTGLHVWWGAFDLSAVRHTGKRITPAPDSGYILRRDRESEHYSAGWWPGDDSFPEPILYAYAIPMPPGVEGAAIAPQAAEWSPDLGEWVLRYEDARTSGNPRGAILEFLESTWGAVAESARWDLARFAFQPPERPERG
jgi:hypothetical protein